MVCSSVARLLILMRKGEFPVTIHYFLSISLVALYLSIFLVTGYPSVMYWYIFGLLTDLNGWNNFSVHF